MGYLMIYSFCWIGKHFQVFLLPLRQVLMLMSPQLSFSTGFMASFIAGGKNINEGDGTGSNNLKIKNKNNNNCTIREKSMKWKHVVLKWYLDLERFTGN